MTSWGGNRQYAQPKKVQEAVSFFQTTEEDLATNFNLLFVAYANAVRNSSSLYVHDVPNSVGQGFPLFQTILKDNSTLKYLKEIPPNSKALNPQAIKADFNRSTNFATLKRMARDLFFYNGETQEKIMTRIRGTGIERTVFDVGLVINAQDKITTAMYVNALTTFAKRLGKQNLSVFVMTDSPKSMDDLKKACPPSWTFMTMGSFSIQKEDLFYQFLTNLHILQNTPNLIVNYSNSIGRFLYLTSRFQHTADSLVSLDLQQWSLV